MSSSVAVVLLWVCRQARSAAWRTEGTIAPAAMRSSHAPSSSPWTTCRYNQSSTPPLPMTMRPCVCIHSYVWLGLGLRLGLGLGLGLVTLTLALTQASPAELESRATAFGAAGSGTLCR